MYKNKKHTNSNTLKTKTLSVVFGMLTIFMFAQKKAENTLLKTINTQKIAKNISKSNFFSDTPIFIAENAVLSIQVEDIYFNKEVFGKGILHIANNPITAITPLVPITVAYVEVENTQLHLHDEFHLTGKLKLLEATILLNEFNLITEQEVVYYDKVSQIIENSTGVWLKKQASISKSFPKNVQINNSNNINIILFSTEITQHNTSYTSNKITSDNTLNTYNFYQVPKPPPKFV